MSKRAPIDVSLAHKAQHMKTQARTLMELANECESEKITILGIRLAQVLRSTAAECKSAEFAIRRYLKANATNDRARMS